ncbi:MAG: type II secretion system F family protein [Pirellulales bacterium]
MPTLGGPVNLLGLIPLGISIFLAVRILYGRRLDRSVDLVRLVLQIVAGVLLAIGVAAIVTALMGVAAIFIGVVIAFNGLIAWAHFHRLERRAVLSYLTAAMERRIPLPVAARAYALERSDSLGRKSLRLAEALESGARLPSALPASGHRFSIGPKLAIGVGDDLGCLEHTLRDAVRLELPQQRASRNWTEILAYGAATLAMTVLVSSFLTYKIFPVFSKMMNEFDLPLTKFQQRVFDACDSVFMGPAAGLAILFVVLMSGVFFLTTTFTLLENWLRRIPVLSWLSMNHDRAWVLRALSWGVAQSRSVPETLASIENHIPISILRPRLRAALAEIQLGVPWTRALQSAGVFDPSQAGLLDSAERAGNLAWACQERADSLLRWFNIRIQMLLSVLLPCMVLLIASFVLLMAFAVMSILSELILHVA